VERLQIIDRFLEKYPEYQRKFTYLSIAPMSRHKIPAYKNMQREVMDFTDRINWKYSTNDWQPIHIIDQTITREKIFEYFHVSDICLVTSLDDGMNLVAKEYVLTCNPRKGMLLLSKFTGAAKDLNEAMLINPYDIEGSSDALKEAIEMSEEEKEKRNIEMRENLEESNIYLWALKFIRNTLRWNDDEE
jgi:trehalose 6-phosphate synthase